MNAFGKIEKSAIFIALVTEEYNKRVDSLNELKHAIQIGKPIIIILYDGAKTPDILKDINHYQFKTTKYDSKNKTEKYTKMMKEIVKIYGKYTEQ